jgi:NAD(P)H-nitrite reductase large subunit
MHGKAYVRPLRVTKQIIIIGNGVAGITAARHLRKRTDHRIMVVGAESLYHYSRPALMYQFMGHLEHQHLMPYETWFWQKNRIGLLHDRVDAVDTTSRVIACAGGVDLRYDELIMATGSRGRRLAVPGIDLEGVQTFTSLQDLEQLERNVVGVARAVVVGGGLIGVEVAEMLRSRGVDVAMLVRDASYWRSALPLEESTIVTNHVRSHGVDVRCDVELMRIEGTRGRVERVIASDGSVLGCELVVLAVGVEPVVDLAQRTGLHVDRGIRINEHFETSAAHVYAIGDCAQFGDGRVELLWYTARAHGEHVAAVIAGDRRPYQRGIFFNSAKFFDLEYQTYGEVPAQADASTSWTWAADDGLRFVRVAIEPTSGRVLGVNALGVRMRHHVWASWISEGRSLRHVLGALSEALFDPEFSPTPRPLLHAARKAVA